jgi:hypothetical protein
MDKPHAMALYEPGVPLNKMYQSLCWASKQQCQIYRLIIVARYWNIFIGIGRTSCLFGHESTRPNATWTSNKMY